MTVADNMQQAVEAATADGVLTAFDQTRTQLRRALSEAMSLEDSFVYRVPGISDAADWDAIWSVSERPQQDAEWLETQGSFDVSIAFFGRWV